MPWRLRFALPFLVRHNLFLPCCNNPSPLTQQSFGRLGDHCAIALNLLLECQSTLLLFGLLVPILEVLLTHEATSADGSTVNEGNAIDECGEREALWGFCRVVAVVIGKERGVFARGGRVTADAQLVFIAAIIAAIAIAIAIVLILGRAGRRLGGEGMRVDPLSCGRLDLWVLGADRGTCTPAAFRGRAGVRFGRFAFRVRGTAFGGGDMLG